MARSDGFEERTRWRCWTPSWRRGLPLIAFTMAIHATVVVLMAFVGVRVRARLESRDLKSWKLVAILICTSVVIGLDVGSGLFVAWRSRPAHRRLAVFRRLDEHARRLRSDAATTLADDGCSGSSRRDSAIWCERSIYFRGHASILVNARRARDPCRHPNPVTHISGECERQESRTTPQ